MQKNNEMITFFSVTTREVKCEGIQGIRRLCKHHPEVLISQLHAVTLAVIAEVRHVLTVMCPIIVCPLRTY